MRHGVDVYDYFADEEDDGPPPIHIILTADQEPSDMATVLIEELGIDEAAKVAAAILQQAGIDEASKIAAEILRQAQGKRVRGER